MRALIVFYTVALARLRMRGQEAPSKGAKALFLDTQTGTVTIRAMVG